MKIYIAGSWKNEVRLRAIAIELIALGHKVDLFCDDSNGRYVFNFSELGNASEVNQIQALEDPKVRHAFEEDRKWIEWANAVLLVLPSGRSAHLEAGYAKGIGKKLFILGDFPNGQLDVMYGFADGIFSYEDLNELTKALHKENVRGEYDDRPVL